MPEPPLTGEHAATAVKLRTFLQETAEYLKRCQDCEIDVSPEIARNQEQLRVLDKITRNFLQGE